MTYDFVLDLRDANGVLVRSMMLELTVTSRPEPLRLPLKQSGLRVASAGSSQAVTPPAFLPAAGEGYGDAPGAARAAPVAKLQAQPINLIVATVKPATSAQLTNAVGAPAKALDPPAPDPPGPPAQPQAGNNAAASTDTNKDSGSAASNIPRFTSKPTLSSSAITVGGPANSEITLRTGSSASDACSSRGTPVIVFGGNNPAQVNNNNMVTFALAETLTEGQYLCATTGTADPMANSGAQQLTDPLDFGRVRAFFTSGMLVANNSTSNASSGSNSAALFLSFNVDKTWALPGCFVLTAGHSTNGSAPVPITNSPYLHQLQTKASAAHDAYLQALVHNPTSPNVAIKKNDWLNAQAILDGQMRTEQKPRWMPGINSYFDVRLTAIPVAATPPTQNGSNSTTPATTNTGTLSTAFLTCQKTGRLGVGIYAPFLVSRWTYNNQPNALFIAPIGKVGFNALTGPTQQTFVVTGGASGTGTTQTITQNFNQLYYFFNFGARIGHYTMTRTNDKAPELNSYLDITFGPYSNLPSYICKAQPANNAPLPLLVGSACNSNYPLAPGSNLLYGDSRTRLWRLDLEGILKVPHTPIIVGFNANIGQKVLAPGHLDMGVQPNDDLRLLFGFRSDIADILQKLGVGNPSK